MNLATQISLACDGMLIHASLLGHAIEANGFASADSYEVTELDVAERRLRSLADKIAEQRAKLIGNEPGGGVQHLIAAE